MFNGKMVPRHQRMLEQELEHILAVLPMHQPDSKEFKEILASAERLHEMMDNTKSTPISREVLVTVAANLLGILLIIKHEDVNVITSKALGFVIRTR